MNEGRKEEITSRKQNKIITMIMIMIIIIIIIIITIITSCMLSQCHIVQILQ